MSDAACPLCGTSLPPYGGRGRPRVFCSDYCRNVAWRAHQRRLEILEELRAIDRQLERVDSRKIKFG